ncbi:unnamed protein product [Acanthoscelides obtectus]|uniref:Thioredoxin domain-containing protein n=1 Tax=Acanthoscelides obtectus TaxID=200917 RepID=A0A9P0JMC5_ACAOB|nr:unnamed protein product [Acanthoscelides obtectus]CAK1634816.1 Thioredoxin domain-containing protein 11 [Acanthoscelides obtectus]
MSLPKKSHREADELSETSCSSQDDADFCQVDTNYGSDIEDNTSTIHLQEEIEAEIPPIAIRMLNLCREFAIFCVIMVTLTALTKDPPKISKPPAAYPFFPKGSLVTDWFRGHVSKAIEYSRTNDIAFIMFYAPWDAESQSAKKEFEIAAKYMQDYVSFSAVNCWHPQSECKVQYSKVYRWPVLIAYPSHGRGVQYSGPMSAPHMIKFLKKICNPIVRLGDGNPKQFEDIYVVAKLNTSPGSRDFAVFYTAALNYVEKDPEYRITFFVTPTPTKHPTLHLQLWNETLVYPTHEKAWSPDEILQWIFKNTHQITTWVTPSGSKSVTLYNNMNNHPTLLLFTPKNPLHHSNDYYNMLQDVSQEYHNCKDNVMVSMHALALKLKRSVNVLHHKTLSATCKAKSKVQTNKRVISTLATAWTNISTCSKKDKGCNFVDKISSFCLKWQSKGTIDLAPLISLTTDELCENCKASHLENYSSMYTGTNDLRSPEALLNQYKKEKCRQFLAAEKLHPAILEAEYSYTQGKYRNVSGLSCQTNKSLTFLAMDSLLNYQFARRLGVDLSSKLDKSAAIIIGDKMESHYILDGPINGITIRDFIFNFTKNQLSRSLESPATLLESERETFKKAEVDPKSIRIKELDTKSFLPTIFMENKAVLVFYYSKQCSFCSGISYTLLVTAKKLAHVDKLLFTRIDGDTNLLPWEYTMESFPTILFIPATSKSESRVFPSSIPINVDNLLGFILTNLDRGLKLQAMWSICKQTKFPDEKSTCYSSLIAETISYIDQTLRQWRRSNERMKQILLYKLKQLRQLHLLFAHSPHRSDLIQWHFRKLNLNLDSTKGYRDGSRFRDEL